MLQTVLVVLPFDRQTSIPASTRPEDLRGVLGIEAGEGRIHVAGGAIGSSVTSIRRSFERLSGIGQTSRSHIQCLLSLSEDRATTNTKSTAELDDYLDGLPRASSDYRVVRFDVPVLASPTQCKAVSVALSHGIGCADATELSRHTSGPFDRAQALFLLIGGPSMFGVLVSGRVADALRHTLAELQPSTAPWQRPDVLPKNDALANALQGYRRLVTKRADALHAPAEALVGQIPTLSWPLPRHRDLRQQIERQVQQPLRVAFLGRFSAGKSSLINALLGIPLLPTSDLPTTATVHRLTYAESSRNDVRFKTAETLAEDLGAILASCGVATERPGIVAPLEQATKSLATTCRDLGSRNLSDEQRRHLIQTNLALTVGLRQHRDKLGKVQQFDRNQLHQLMMDGGTTLLVAEIRSQGNLPLLAAGLELVDLPGVDSMTVSHRDLADREVADADLVVYVMLADRPFDRFDFEQLDALYKARPPASVVLCANKCDLARDPERSIRECRRQHQSHFRDQELVDILPVSGLLGMCARACLAGNKSLLSESDFTFYRSRCGGLLGLQDLDHLEMSNTLDFEATLARRAAEIRGPIVIEAVNKVVQTGRAAIRTECEGLRATWSKDERSRHEQISAMLALQTEYEGRRDTLMAALQQRANDVASAAKARLSEGFEQDAGKLCMAYIRDYKEYIAFSGALSVLEILGSEAPVELRALFDRRLAEKKDAIVADLMVALEQIWNDARAFADDLERASWRSVFGENFVLSTTPPFADERLAVRASSMSAAPQSFTERTLIRLDPSAILGEIQLAGRMREITRKLIEESAASVEATIESARRRIERAAHQAVDARLGETRARAETYRAQLTTLARDHSKWSRALGSYERALDEVLREIVAVRWADPIDAG